MSLDAKKLFEEPSLIQITTVPVKVKGAGIYLGDMHAMQGNGEIAGHTTDVAGIATVQVKVLKGVTVEGPIILPNEDDLPPMAKPSPMKKWMLHMF